MIAHTSINYEIINKLYIKYEKSVIVCDIRINLDQITTSNY